MPRASLRGGLRSSQGLASAGCGAPRSCGVRAAQADGNGTGDAIAGMDDAAQWMATREAMGRVGLSAEEAAVAGGGSIKVVVIGFTSYDSVNTKCEPTWAANNVF